MPSPEISNCSTTHEHVEESSKVLETLSWRGAPSARRKWLAAMALWYAGVAACLVGSVSIIRSSDTVGGWFEGGLLFIAAILGGAVCPVLFGLDPIRGESVVTTFDADGVTIDRTSIKRGVLRVPWRDIESVVRQSYAVGLVLRSYEGLLERSDQQALNEIGRQTIYLRIAAALKATSSLPDLIETATTSLDADRAAVSDRGASCKRAIAALQLARRLGGRELDFPFWERDVSTKSFAARVERYIAQSCRA